MCNRKAEQESSIYGYARVSTEKQSLQRQITNLTKYDSNIVIYQEKYSGKHIENRQELKKLLSIVSSGDTIVFDSVSRMSRNADEGFALYKELYQKGINLVFLNESYINTEVYTQSIKSITKANCLSSAVTDDDSANKLIKGIMDSIQEYTLSLLEKQIKEAFAQAEKELKDISSRIKQGLRERKAKGLSNGNTKGSTRERHNKQDRIVKIKALSKAFGGKFTDRQIVEMLRISTATLSKYKKEIKEQLENN